MFLFHPMLTSQFAKLLKCEQLSMYERFLREDLTTRCWSSQHWKLLLELGLPLLIYMLGLPIVTFWWICKNQPKVEYLAVHDIIENKEQNTTISNELEDS